MSKSWFLQRCFGFKDRLKLRQSLNEESQLLFAEKFCSFLLLGNLATKDFVSAPKDIQIKMLKSDYFQHQDTLRTVLKNRIKSGQSGEEAIASTFSPLISHIISTDDVPDMKIKMTVIQDELKTVQKAKYIRLGSIAILLFIIFNSVLYALFKNVAQGF